MVVDGTGSRGQRRGRAAAFSALVVSSFVAAAGLASTLACSSESGSPASGPPQPAAPPPAADLGAPTPGAAGSPAAAGTPPSAVAAPPSEPPVAPAADAAPPAPVAAGGPEDPLFTTEGTPVSRPLYAGRLADQVDLRYFEGRVRDLRFGLRTGVVWQGLPGDFQVRGAWAVPLARTKVGGHQSLAVATTRCVLDYRYPPVPSQPRLFNLALVSGAGRPEQVYRINDPSVLPGVQHSLDIRRTGGPLQTNELWRSRPLADRYFDQLFPEKLPPASAALAEGEWRDASGVDLAVVYLPEDDPGVETLRPRDNLGMDRHMAVLAETLEARVALWGEALDFPVTSQACPRDSSPTPRELETDRTRFQMIAAATALSRLLPVLERPLADEGSALVREIVSREPRLSGPEWRTRPRGLQAADVEEVAWDASGRLVLRRAGRGRDRQAVLAGVGRAGLDDGAAARVVATVRAAIAAEGSHLVLLTADGHDPVVSIMVHDQGLDLSAELLRRGLVRLDTADRATLTQQPTLVRAAQQALLDPEARAGAAVSDPLYQAAIRDLGAALGVVL